MSVHPFTQLMTSAFGNVWNKYISNAPSVWDRMYDQAYADKLDSQKQQARNYMLGGIVSSCELPKPRVLDVGCGNGSLLKVLGIQNVDYFGIDVSKSAIDAARARWSHAGFSLRFEVMDFSNWAGEEKFDFVIFNEVLYYFPLGSIENTMANAGKTLTTNGQVLVSMSTNPKARWIWKRCANVLDTKYELFVKSGPWTSWRVKAFEKAATSATEVSYLSAN